MATAAAEDLLFAAAKTSVWWDIENCQVPSGRDAHGITPNISSALSKMNYSGPVTVFVYGDTNRIPSSVQQALSSTGVSLNHVPSGVKDASDKKILVDMLFWAVDNPAPANIMLISGDRDFSNALHQLRMRRYNILLAQPQKASVPLVAAAKTVWLWTSLAAGGCPLPCGDSSSVPVDGCPEALNRSASERALPSQAMGSNSQDRGIGDSESGGNYIPKASNQTVQQETKRNELPNSGGTNDFCRVCTLCKAVCYSLETFTAHLSGKKHAAQVAASELSVGAGPSISSSRSEASVSTKPVKKPSIMKPVWCNVCKISCNSKVVYTDHIQGQKHQMNLEAKLSKQKKTSAGPTERPEKEMDKKKKKLENKKQKMIEGGVEAAAIRVCDLCEVVCENRIAFRYHLKGRKHVANVEKQREALSDPKKILEERIAEKDQPSEVIEFTVEQENVKCLEKQGEEPTERFSTESCGYVEEWVENVGTPPPNAERIFTDLKHENPAPEEARSCLSRECMDENFRKIEEPSRNVNTIEKLEEELGTKDVKDSNNACTIC